MPEQLIPPEDDLTEETSKVEYSTIASALGGLIIERNLRKGHTLEIRSLGIRFSLYDEEHPPTEEEAAEMEALRLEDVVDDAEMWVRHGYVEVPPDDTNGFLTPVLLFVREAYLHGEINIGSYEHMLEKRVQQLLQETDVPASLFDAETL